MPFLDDPIAAISSLPILVLPLFVLFSAGVEYVFPPYWGDMFVLVGFFLAGQQATSPWILFLAAFTGSMMGAAAAFSLGRHFGLRMMARLTSGHRHRRMSKRVRRLFRRFGERVLVANRFLPFVRGLLLFGAGAFDLRFWPSMLFTGLSNIAWISLLAAIGLVSAGSWEQIESTFRQYSVALGIAATVVVLAGLMATWWQSSRALEADESNGNGLDESGPSSNV